jgi:uncharacterized protein YrrD
MRKGSDILGKVIVAYNSGRRVARVQDLIFDQNSSRLLGFLVEEGGWFQDPQVLPWQSIQAIGLDAIVIPAKSAILSSGKAPEIQAVLANKLVLKGTRILTTDGQFLGTLVDLYFDDQTGKIEGYEASGGLFADAYTGRSFVPTPQAINIGADVTFVPPETADLMEEQVGGIKAAVQTASTRLHDSTELASQRLQAAAHSANERLQQAAEETNRRLQEATHSTNVQLQETAHLAGERLDQSSQLAAASITNALVSPEAQLEQVVGKPVEHDILTPDGMVLLVKDQVVTLSMAEEAQRLGILDQVYRATGGSLTAEINRRLQESTTLASARLQAATQSTIEQGRRVIEQAKGRRTQHMVRDEEGRIIAAPGQIVTDRVIERAQTNHREAALLDAVGLPSPEVIRARTTDALSEMQIQLKERGAIVQENASTFWQEVQTQFRDFQERGGQAIHQRRIEQALGRPVTRVILDPQDNVILNVGELITHRAIREAEAAGVLNILLNSVYVKHPMITDRELRAPEPGRASLEHENGLVKN